MILDPDIQIFLWDQNLQHRCNAEKCSDYLELPVFVSFEKHGQCLKINSSSIKLKEKCLNIPIYLQVYFVYDIL